MKTVWEKGLNSTGVLKATVDGDMWSDAQKKAFKKVASKVNVKGFREGQAPEAMVRKMVGDAEIFYEAVDQIANKVLSDALDQEKLTLVARPTLEIESMTKDEAVLKFNCTVSPEVTLGDYTGLTYQEEKVSATAGEIKERLSAIQREFTEQVVKEEGALENGEIANIDFEGFKDDVAFEGGKGEDYPLEIGSGTFIPGFEEQLIGMNVGEERDINVTFPEEYGAADLAGKEVVFKVKLNSIKQNVVPELNDDLAKDLDEEGIETLKDLEKKIKKEIIDAKQETADNKIKDDLLKQVAANATVDIPEAMIDNEVEFLLNDLKNRVMQRGFSYETYLQMTGKTEDAVKEELRAGAPDSIKTRLVLAKIVENEKLDATDEEFENEIAKIAKDAQMEVDQIKNFVSEADLKYELSLRKALDFVKDKAIAKKPEKKEKTSKAKE